MPLLDPVTLPAAAGAIAIDADTFRRYINPELGDCRGHLETMGPWQLPVRFKAPAVSVTWGAFSAMETITLYGWRTLTDLQQSGYALDGRCSIGGRKRSAFTSSQLWQLPDGQLIETAVIHVRPLKP